MTMIAFAFLQARRLKAAGRKKKGPSSPAATEPTSYQAGDLEPAQSAAAAQLSSLS